jgi:uncharacterized metal-binding protein
MAESWTHEQREQEVGPLALLRVAAAEVNSIAASLALAIEEHSKKRLCCAPEVSLGVSAKVEEWRKVLLFQLQDLEELDLKLHMITGDMAE